MSVGKFYFNGDEENPGQMAPGECTEYVESAPAAFLSQLTIWAGTEAIAAPDLPFGFYSFHVKRGSDGKATVERIQDHPPVLTRICNRTHRDAGPFTLSFDPLVIGQPLAPDACTAYRPAVALYAYRGGPFFLNATEYAVAPMSASASLGPGAWTFDLVIADDTAHLVMLRRRPSAD